MTMVWQFLVSAISAWEIALLVGRDRLTLGMNLDDWLETVSEIEGVRFVALDEVESERINMFDILRSRVPGVSIIYALGSQSAV